MPKLNSLFGSSLSPCALIVAFKNKLVNKNKKMLKKIVGGALLGLLGTSSTLLGQVQAQENNGIETIKTQELSSVTSSETINLTRVDIGDNGLPIAHEMYDNGVFDDEDYGGYEFEMTFSYPWFSSDEVYDYVRPGYYAIVDLHKNYSLIDDLLGGNFYSYEEWERGVADSYGNSRYEIANKYILNFETLYGSNLYNYVFVDFSEMDPQTAYSLVYSLSDSYSWDVYFYKEVASPKTNTKELEQNAIDIDGDAFFDDLTIKKIDNFKYTYNVWEGSTPKEKLIAEYLSKLTKPILVHISVDGLNTAYDCDFPIYNGAQLVNKQIAVDDFGVIDISSIYNEYDFYGILDPKNQNNLYFEFARFENSSDSNCSIEGFSFYNIIDKDYQAPVISGQFSFISNVDNPLTLEDVLNEIKAIDDFDGSVPVILESSDYDPNNLILGEQYMQVSASDNAGNVSYETITINVVDNTPPEISGKNTYETSYYNELSVDLITNALILSDNFTKKENLNIELLEDGYTGNENKKGSYVLRYYLEDEAGNNTQYEVVVKVIDDKKPIITLPKDLSTGNNQLIKLDEIKDLISVSDEYDGVINDFIIEGYDNYEENYHIVGAYNFIVSAFDSSGNKTETELVLLVKDTIAPELIFDGYFIVLEAGEDLEIEQIKIMISDLIGVSENSILSVEGNYNINVPGDYVLNVLTSIVDEPIKLTVRVLENYESNSYRELKWYEYIYTWFTILFNINKEYKTDSFWDFSERWGYVVEVYDSGKILLCDTTEEILDYEKGDVESELVDDEKKFLSSLLFASLGFLCAIPFATQIQSVNDDNVKANTNEISMTYSNYLNEMSTNSETYHFVVNVNNMLSIDNILEHIEAVDETDGDVPVLYEVSRTTYNPEQHKLGKFELLVYAVDNSGNRVEQLVYITVVDIDKPAISGKNKYSISYNESLDIDTIKENLIVNDNYDESLNLELVNDTYTENKSKIGNYNMVFNTQDSSGNLSDDFEVLIEVVDDLPPIITAPGKIEVGNNTELTLEQLKEKITINDGYDGTITDYTIEGFENYLTNKNKVGEYEITLKVSDSSGNQASTKLTIQVVDKEEPYFVFDDFFIILDEGEELTKEQIIEYATKVLGIEKEEILSVEGEYDTTTPGNYKVKLMTMAGEEYTFNISVNKDFEDETLYRELKWYEYIYTWFTILFNINKEYKTDSFWDFSERWGYVVEVYDTGKIRKEGTKQEVETTVVESKNEDDVTKETLNN